MNIEKVTHKNNPQSRETLRSWMLEHFKMAIKTHNKNHQFWQYGNHAEEIYSVKFMWSKLDDIHLNSVKADVVEKSEH